MNKSLIENKETFVPISELAGKEFHVEDYQRGYKWGKKEINLLLDDINKHDTQKGPYCLQPIVVKPMPNSNTYEVIDGQQRLTSIYLLMQYFESNQPNQVIDYSIVYKTREKSEKFLNNKDSFAKIVQAEKWQDFVIENPEDDNVDIFHFYEVYKAIYDWFDEDKNEIDFLNKVKNNLHIIWYDVTLGTMESNLYQKAEDIFVNFNANKVLLSNSELIKALFILDHDGNLTKKQRKHKAITLALEWDAIENRLQEPSFWYFICKSDKYNKSATRIDFLFDILAGTLKNKKDNASYNEYEKRITSEKSKQEEWQKIKTLFYKLNEWYLDNELYHYVGFLIATDIMNIKEIIDESRRKKKKFKKFLKQRIRQEFHGYDKEDSNDLIKSINYIDNYKECKYTLLLLNVRHYLKNMSDNKFPFNLYYENSWSIEHINPQNPKGFESYDQFVSWVKSVKYLVKSNDGLKEKLNSVTKEISSSNFDKKIKSEDFVKTFGDVTQQMGLHNISNLALLDRNTNSALGNTSYLSKRKMVLKFDRLGKDNKGNKVFVPLCTRDVFTKTYSYLNKKSINDFFGPKDMDDYEKYINKELKYYLPKEKVDEPL